jgi:hypothetical protein
MTQERSLRDLVLHPQRNFDSDVRIVRRAMRDRRERNLLARVGARIRMINGKNNGVRPILAPLCLPSLPFFVPKIRVRK